MIKFYNKHKDLKELNELSKKLVDYGDVIEFIETQFTQVHTIDLSEDKPRIEPVWMSDLIELKEFDDFIHELNFYEEEEDIDPVLNPAGYALQLKRRKQKLRQALIDLGQGIKKKQDKLLRIKRRILKSTYSNNQSIDSRKSLRKILKRNTKSCLKEEDDTLKNHQTKSFEFFKKIINLIHYEHKEIITSH